MRRQTASVCDVMAPLAETKNTTSTNEGDTLSGLEPQPQADQPKKMASGGYQDYQPKQTRYNKMMYGERKLNRPRAEPTPKREKVYRPQKWFRKVEKCYLMPMGPEYTLHTQTVRDYEPSKHPPTFKQRRLQPIDQDRPYRPYQWRQYRLTGTNYGYGIAYVPKPDRVVATASPSTTSQEVKVNEDKVKHDDDFVPVGGVAVLPPILGATPKPEPKPQPKPAPRKEGIAQYPMPERFDSNGMYIVRDYRYTQRNYRFDKYPRYREYRNPKALPHREYNYQLVYLGGRPIGHRIQKRQFERVPVKREIPAQKPRAAPIVPVVAPIVAPAAASAPASTPPEEPIEEEDPPEEPKEEPRPPVVAAAAVVQEPGKDVVEDPVQKAASPQPEPSPRQETPMAESPEPQRQPPSPSPVPPVAAAAVVTRAATPPRQASPPLVRTPTPAPRQLTPSPVNTPTPAPRQRTSSVGNVPLIAGAALGGAAVGAAATTAAVAATSNAKTPSPTPRRSTPSPQPAAAAAAAAPAPSNPSNNSSSIAAPVAAAVTGAIAGAAVGAAVSSNTNTNTNTTDNTNDNNAVGSDDSNTTATNTTAVAAAATVASASNSSDAPKPSEAPQPPAPASVSAPGVPAAPEPEVPVVAAVAAPAAAAAPAAKAPAPAPQAAPSAPVSSWDLICPKAFYL